MKQLILLTLFTLSFLHADLVEDFINKQVTIEKKVNLNENNFDAVEGRLEVGNKDFLNFYFDYVNQRNKKHSGVISPYQTQIFKLKRRIKTNTLYGNKRAVYRDELKLYSIDLKMNMRSSLNEVVSLTQKGNFSTFEKSLDKLIIERHKREPTVDLKRYNFVRDLKTLDPIDQSVLDNLREFIALQDIHNDLSAVLIENRRRIYKIGVMSGYGILAFAMKIEDSNIGRKVTPYLEPFALSSSKLTYIALILIFISLIRFILSLIFDLLYHRIAKNDNDVAYIVSKTKMPFNILLIAIGLELIFMVFSALSDVDWVFTLFEITYVVGSFFLLYRFSNATAVIKMEDISNNSNVRNEVVNLGLKMMNVFIGIIALIFVLKLLGVNLTALLSGLGIGGVAVAFAAKDTIANFFGSVSILLSEMFEQGDWIAVDDMEGHVVEIGLRATTIRTFDNALIAIPNFKLSDNGIKNWSRRKLGRRIRMIIGVTYQSDMDDIRQALEEIRSMLKEHPDLMGEKTQYMGTERQLKLVSKEDLKGIKRQILVYLDAFDSSSINILVYCFSRSVVWSDWCAVKEDIMFKIADILKANNLEFAYPTMVIHQAKEVEESETIA